jgi:hypothetical protein
MAATYNDPAVTYNDANVTYNGAEASGVLPSTGYEDWITSLQRLANSTSFDENLLLNQWAGTTGKDRVTAINTACGTTGLDVPAAISTLAFGVPGHDVPESLAAIVG